MAPNSPPMWRVFSAEEVAENAERCGSTACALEEGGKEIHLLACAERIHLKRRIFCIDCIDKHNGGWDDLLAALDEPLTADHLRLLESKCSTRGGGGGGGSGGASRKRKARELEPSDDETEDEERERSEYIPSLPATCLASVLNFMLYSDVRKCMLVGKIMPNEVAKHVEALTIDTEAGMDVPAARRFPNVKKVNIACLLKCKVLDKHGYAGRYNLSPLVAPKVVPFLSIFPRLEKCFIGGIAQNTFFFYHPSACDEPSDNKGVFQSMVEALCAAYSTRVIPADLDIRGLFEWHDHWGCELRDAEDRPCRLCRSICRHFPLPGVLMMDTWSGDDYHALCVSRTVMCAIVKERPRGKEILASEAVAMCMLGKLVQATSDEIFTPDAVFVRRMKDDFGLDFEGETHLKCLIISESVLCDVEDMVSSGASFRSITEEEVVTEGWTWGIAKAKEELDEDYIWFSKDFERLVAVGVPLDRSKVILWDGLLG